jgi:hypothetical protein
MICLFFSSIAVDSSMEQLVLSLSSTGSRTSFEVFDILKMYLCLFLSILIHGCLLSSFTYRCISSEVLHSLNSHNFHSSIIPVILVFFIFTLIGNVLILHLMLKFSFLHFTLE